MNKTGKQKTTTKKAPPTLSGVAKEWKKEATVFKWEDVNLAINDIGDIAERIMLNVIILGDLAKAAREHNERLTTDHLEWGIYTNNMTPEVKSLFKTWGFTETKFGYEYTFSPPTKWDVKIPVKIRVLKKHYKFLANPDRGWYGTNDFWLPNPFDAYWKARHLLS